MKWEDARDAWAKKVVGRDDIEIQRVEFTTHGGGEVQIGDMTWDYEQAHIEVEIWYTEIDEEYPTRYTTFDVETFDGLLADILSVSD